MKRIALLCMITLSISPFVLSQQLGSEHSTASCSPPSGGRAATNSIEKFTSACYVEASAISDAAGRGNNQILSVPPMITSFTPTSGPVGTKVSIKGTGFIGTTKVTFGGFEARFVVNTDKLVNAAVPSAAKTGKIVITTPGGTASSARTFTVTTNRCTPVGYQCGSISPHVALG